MTRTIIAAALLYACGVVQEADYSSDGTATAWSADLFYRAGFQWGHYYNSTSDGMHFTLTDNIRNSHDGGNRGLRKVYEYSETY